MGGLGIPRAENIAVSAFLGSTVDTSELQLLICKSEAQYKVEVARLVDLWNRTHYRAKQITAESDELKTGKTQRALTEEVHETTLRFLKENGDATFRTIVLANTMERSGKWTDVLPNSTHGLFMNADAFSAALKYRLGIDIFNHRTKCSLCNKSVVDKRGHHLATCKKIHAVHHNHLRDLLHAEAARAHLSPMKEPLHLLIGNRGNQRPADVLIPNFVSGRDLCIDVTVVSTFRDVRQGSQQQGYHAECAATTKTKKYENAVRDQRMDFVPFAMECMGGLSKSCEKVLSLIGQNLASVTNSSPHAAKNRVHDKLVFQWMRDLGTKLAYHARQMSQNMLTYNTYKQGH